MVYVIKKLDRLQGLVENHLKSMTVGKDLLFLLAVSKMHKSSTKKRNRMNTGHGLGSSDKKLYSADWSSTVKTPCVHDSMP